MTDSWYYRFLDQELGPVDFRALQQLAIEGTIGRGDFVRCDGDAEWRPAETVSGLIPEAADVDDLAGMLGSEQPGSNSARRKRGDECFYRVGGSAHGPIPFEELASLARAWKLDHHDEVRIGRAGDWVRADSIVGLFDPLSDELGDLEIVSGPSPVRSSAPVPVDRSWYCRILRQEIGPFTFDDVHAMAQRGELSEADEVRHGEHGSWQSAGTIVGLIPEAASLRPELAARRPGELDGESQHVAPQRRAVGTRSSKEKDAVTPAAEPAEARDKAPAARPGSDAAAKQPAAAPPSPATPPAGPQAYTAPPVPRPPVPAPVSRPRRSVGNPLSGIAGSVSSLFSGININWKHIAAVAALLAVAAVMYGGLPFVAGPGQAVYEETAVIWERTQTLSASEVSDADWQTFKSQVEPRVEELSAELAEKASARERLLQLMLYCHRDCLPRILSAGPQGAPEAMEEMATYMNEAQALAAR